MALRIKFGMALLALSLLSALPAASAPSAEPWSLWDRSDPASVARIDHAGWAAFLRAHLKTGPDGINRIDYAAVSAAEREALQRDLQDQAALPVSRFARPEQRAYWIDLYNELTVVTVLLHWPVASIRDISLSHGLFSAGGPWDAKLVTVEGTPLSLNDIEHRILRPIWHDPRTHYAVNCASLGCPNLAPVPYTGATVEAMLDAAARDYVNSPRGAEVADGRLTASRIYDWYQADFGGGEAGVIAHLKRYARPEMARALEGVTGVATYRYDWSINAAK